jgi:hypothetical protein
VKAFFWIHESTLAAAVLVPATIVPAVIVPGSFVPAVILVPEQKRYQ